MKPGGIDVALRYGDGNWPGLDAEMFMPVQMIVAGAPSLLQGHRVEKPEDLLDLPWVEELGTTEASNWMRSRGVDAELRGARFRVPGNLLLEAVLRGQGIAVKIREFVQDELDNGRLLELFHEHDHKGYHIVTRAGVVRPQAKLFISWLRRQAQKDAEDAVPA